MYIADIPDEFSEPGMTLRSGKMAASLKIIDGNQANGMKNSEREKALEAALAQIDRAFGKG